jgi:hypothetical protein
MRKLIATAAILLAVPVLVLAQDADHQYHGQGYLFFAGAPSSPGFGVAGSSFGSPQYGVGGSTTALQFGGGGEWLAGHGVGLGGELLNSTQSWEGATLGTWIGSVNASYHFGASRKNREVEPFVTGGYTFFYVSNIGFPHDNGGNLGLGLNIWLKGHAALRLEIRDDVGGQDLSAEFEPEGTYYLRSSRHLVGFRIGVTFR